MTYCFLEKLLFDLKTYKANYVPDTLDYKYLASCVDTVVQNLEYLIDFGDVLIDYYKKECLKNGK